MDFSCGFRYRKCSRQPLQAAYGGLYAALVNHFRLLAQADCTANLDLETGRNVWMARGKHGGSLKPFWRALRRALWREATGRMKLTVKGTRYLLLTRLDNLSDEQLPRLEAAVKANEPRWTGYVAQEMLGLMWEQTSKSQMARDDFSSAACLHRGLQFVARACKQRRLALNTQWKVHQHPNLFRALGKPLPQQLAAVNMQACARRNPNSLASPASRQGFP